MFLWNISFTLTILGFKVIFTSVHLLKSKSRTGGELSQIGTYAKLLPKTKKNARRIPNQFFYEFESEVPITLQTQESNFKVLTFEKQQLAKSFFYKEEQSRGTKENVQQTGFFQYPVKIFVSSQLKLCNHQIFKKV